MTRQLIVMAIVAGLMAWPLSIAQDHWWAFILATAAIAAALRLLLGEQWRGAAGLNLSPRHAVSALLGFAAVATASTLLLHQVYAAAGLRADAPALKDQVGFLFQALNEEILFRALLIGLLVRCIPSRSAVSLGVAALFAAAHFAFYRFSHPMHVVLSPPALATLFLAGVAMNNLYLAFRHIGFSWALHAGWNVVWLPSAIYDVATGARLREPQVFDRVLGAPTMVVTASAAAILTVLLLARWLKNTQ